MVAKITDEQKPTQNSLLESKSKNLISLDLSKSFKFNKWFSFWFCFLFLRGGFFSCALNSASSRKIFNTSESVNGTFWMALDRSKKGLLPILDLSIKISIHWCLQLIHLIFCFLSRNKLVIIASDGEMVYELIN